jgi:hypothetical protein
MLRVGQSSRQLLAGLIPPKARQVEEAEQLSKYSPQAMVERPGALSR